MKLLYTYIGRFGDVFKDQFFNFSDQYIVSYSNKYNEIYIEDNKDYLKNFYGEVLSDVTAVVGENGVGKTTLLDLIGRTYKDRLELSNIDNDNKIIDKYFIIYYVEDNIFYFEGVGDIIIKNFNGYEKLQEKSKSKFKSFYFAKHGNSYKICEYENWVNEKIVYINDNYIKSSEDLFYYSESQDEKKEFIPRILSDSSSINEWYTVYLDLVDSGMVKSKETTIVFSRNEDLLYTSIFDISPINKGTIEYLDPNLLYTNEYLSDFFSHFISCIVDYIIKKSTIMCSNNINIEWNNLQRTYRHKTDLTSEEYKKLFATCINIIEDNNNSKFVHSLELDALIKYIRYIDELFDKLYKAKEYIIPGINEFKFKLKCGEKNTAVIEFLESFVNIQKFTTSLNRSNKEDWIFEKDDFEDYRSLNLQLVMPFDICKINMSTGEKKLITLLSQISYEVKKYSYIQPIRANSREKNYIVLVDEIESTMHLEWSRNLLNFIIEYMEKQYFVYGFDNTKKYSYKDLGICVQLIFTTHSPFLLSDLKENSVIALEFKDGFVSKKKNICSFAQNIQRIMANEFFIKDCYGAFASKKIEYVIDKLNLNKELSTNERNKILLIIKEIGEPILRNKLLEMYTIKFNSSKKEKNKLLNVLKSFYGDIDEKELLEKVKDTLTKEN